MYLICSLVDNFSPELIWPMSKSPVRTTPSLSEHNSAVQRLDTGILAAGLKKISALSPQITTIIIYYLFYYQVTSQLLKMKCVRNPYSAGIYFSRQNGL